MSDVDLAEARHKRILDDYTPTEWLVIEVLAARWRLGEKLWPFPTELTATLRKLEERGVVGFKSGIAERTRNAWLTEQGAAQYWPKGVP